MDVISTTDQLGKNHLGFKPETLRRVPELSLNSYIEGTATDRQRFIDDFFHGIKDYGFIVLKDHPIPTPLLNSAYALLEQLFALPVDVKLKYALKEQGFQRGYTPFGQEHAKDSPVMDLKEFWHVGRDLPEGHRYQSIYPANVWPAELPEFRAVMSKIYRALDEAGKIMLESLTFPLDLPRDFFSNMMGEGNSILRLLHYPPIPAGVDPRCVRAAAHEDINLITVLVAATASGLELKDRDGTWLPIDSDPNSLIVDAGDMLSRLTNNVIPSTTHRVVNPDDGTNSARYSMPYFIHPNPDAMLTCLPSCVGEGAKYPPISAQDFLYQRLREIGLLK
ncbi:MAG TPA: 2-oxoglutarate and iron-dependent oxygenase domain-containing protein [Pseudobdellovibrionaceae bacterium]|nr:2-oxoglutarate and iron-dependent oxygenase domain-containing protein [Pseudobdellovibrionaceae bacterium]